MDSYTPPNKMKWYNSLKPASKIFGYDRGQPIIRYYIEQFLKKHSHFISGDVLEVGDRAYTNQFGSDNVKRSLVLDYGNTSENTPDTISCDLEEIRNIPENIVDCFIMVETLSCIFNVQIAVRNAVKLIRPGGTLITVVSGLSPISTFDYSRWGHYWNFTDMSLKKLLDDVIPAKNTTTITYGNVKAATDHLYGFASSELTKEQLDFVDKRYQIVIASVSKIADT